ncbi:hypothetical protein [Microbulbifer variabilis]|uniref:hypothetical protein n=1 Tax=Microbulbifer variabilis TaxID=266805 RepID=UPI0012FABDE0|nr:hypothetical protein [Microbulbifer variabilis]
MMSNEAEEIKLLFQQLIQSEPFSFPKEREVLMAPKDRGVYLIFSNLGAVLHVGNTPTGKDGINQRLKDHLRGASSFVRDYLNGNGSSLRRECYYKYLPVSKSRQRALLEAYATGCLCPKHFGHRGIDSCK